ncbi:MAG: hypothetical protein ACYTFG_16370, partial [Planctomycetota bacterium]
MADILCRHPPLLGSKAKCPVIEDMEKKKPVKIPGYKAVAVLGKGVQGVVYKGVHEASGMPVAIKVLSRKWAKIAEFKERFLR